jgi:hypothetical protein
LCERPVIKLFHARSTAVVGPRRESGRREFMVHHGSWDRERERERFINQKISTSYINKRKLSNCLAGHQRSRAGEAHLSWLPILNTYIYEKI